jgi:predicted methyltransferase
MNSDVDHSATTAKEQKLDNITGVQCDQVSCNLPESYVAAVFICDTYHHFEIPRRTLATIHKALKPGGTLILIDFKRVEGVKSENTIKHVRASQEVFTAAIRDAGFIHLVEVKLLKENYLVGFEKQGERK